MALNVELLQSSFKLLAPKADQLVDRFYQILFDRYPAVKPLFANSNMADQRKMLLRALSIIVNRLDDPKFLSNYLHGLGKTHVAYGTQPAHYDAVGECLLASMAEAAGAKWNPALQQEWTTAYGAIKSLMLEGAAK